MAIENLKSDLRTILADQNSYTAIAKAISGSGNYAGISGYKIHTIEIFVDESAKKLRKATIEGIVQHFGNRAKAAQYIKQYRSSFQLDNFILAILSVINTFTNSVAMYGNKGSRFRKSKMGIFKNVVRDTLGGQPGTALFVIQATDMNYSAFLGIFRMVSFRTWKAKAKVLPNANPSHKRKRWNETETMPGGREVPGRYRETQYLEGVHDPHSVYLAWIELKAHEIQAEIIATIGEVNIVQEILDALQVNWEEDTDYNAQRGTIEQKRILSVKLGPENLPLIFDKAGIPDIIDALTNIQYGLLYGMNYIGTTTAFDAVASPSFKQQAAAAAQYKILRDLMTKNKHHIVKKAKLKKPSTKPRSAPLRTAKPRKSGKKSRVTLPQRVRVQRVVEKGQGKEASTSQAADLARLRQYINRRLPAEVRRNMGRPALQNRTGRFSNSVQLQSLTEAQNTIMAKYTYLLSPYQTFENTGRRRWPLAYNPKTLIAKSIRNLAQGRIEQKLTVRRV